MGDGPHVLGYEYMNQTHLLLLQAITDGKAKMDKYKKLLTDTLVAAKEADINTFVAHMLTEDVPIVTSRQLAAQLVEGLPSLKNTTLRKAVMINALRAFQPRVVSFEEHVTSIRENLAEIYQDEEEWVEAAKTLAGIPLESARTDDLYKAKTYVKIAQLYLETEESIQADAYLKRASHLITPNTESSLRILYAVCSARVNDFKRNFQRAAMSYYQISHDPAVAEAEQLSSLGFSITCAILAAAGPQRSRMLATLYKDERSARMPSYSMLEKMFLERILRKAEVEAFGKTLRGHQLAKVAEGGTVYDRAVIQHNLLSASKLYTNISFAELGSLLGIQPERAEKVASKMVNEGRLVASIDQIESFIFFSADGEALTHWDNEIEAICNDVNKVVEDMTAKYPGVVQLAQ